MPSSGLDPGVNGLSLALGNGPDEIPSKQHATIFLEMTQAGI